MDFETYLKLSGKTASKESFPEGVDTTAIKIGILSSIESAGFLDKIKRGIFYGKVSDEVGREPYSLPPVDLGGEKADLLHAALGLVTEANEVLESVFNHVFLGGELDSVNLSEESGDMMWYLALLFRSEGFSLGDVLEKNIQKLERRYGGSFSRERAIYRNLESERDALEGN